MADGGSLPTSMCICGHTEQHHRRTGACMAIAPNDHPLFIDPLARSLCPCNDFTPVPQGQKS